MCVCGGGVVSARALALPLGGRGETDYVFPAALNRTKIVIEFSHQVGLPSLQPVHLQKKNRIDRYSSTSPAVGGDMSLLSASTSG